MDLYERLKKNEMLYRQGRIDVEEDGLEFIPTEKEECSIPNIEPELIRMGLDPLRFSRAMQCGSCGTFFLDNRFDPDRNIECPFCWKLGTSIEHK